MCLPYVCPDTRQDNAGTGSGDAQTTSWKVCLILAGVVATSCLVVSNRYVLQMLGSGALPASALTFVHSLCTLVVFRNPVTGVSASAAHQLPSRTPLSIALLSTSSLMFSNLLLKQSSVSLHQITRILAIPLGALLDRCFGGRKRSHRENILVCAICYCACMSLGHLQTVTIGTCVLMCAFMSTYLATALVVRHVATSHHLPSASILRCTLPYTLLIALVTFIITIHVDRDIKIPSFDFCMAGMLLLNCSLAVAVQYLSTWTMKHTSLQLYTVLGQIKTSATICLAWVCFGENVTVVSAMCIMGVLVFGLALTLYESAPADQSSNDMTKATYAICIIASTYCLILLHLSKEHFSTS